MLDVPSLTERLQQLENRLSRIEAHVGLAPVMTATGSEPAPQRAASSQPYDEDELEFNIGQFLVAQIGIVVLVVGIAFLLILPFAHVPRGLPAALGFSITAAMLILSHYVRRSFEYVARCLLGGGLFLLYFSTLRLHFFSAEPLLTSPVMEVGLLTLATIGILLVAAGAHYGGLAGLGLILGYVTAIVSVQTWFLLPATLSLAVLSVVFSLRRKWRWLVPCAILLSYLTHLVWLLNNPIMGGDVRLLTSPRVHLLFLLGYCLTFAAAGLFQNSAHGSRLNEELQIAQVLMAGVGGYGLYLLGSIAAYQEQAAWPQVLASIFFLSSASAFWVHRRSRYETFIYAMLGYGALTVAIVLKTGRPEVFIWLCWQSMLVLATALWFRSKFIVLGNFVIYTAVLLTYLILDGRFGWVGLHFGIVAMLSARVLNWQKSRLELRTESMRNCYLAVTFLVIPYALWRLVPREYVALSWLAVGVIYYALSIAINNRKYRWMALLTLLLTVCYVFVIGIARLGPVFRVVSFIALGSALLVVALIYTGMRARRTATQILQDPDTPAE